MPTHHIIRFPLNLTYAQYLSVYQGVAKNISAIAEDGRRIQFPAGNVQQFLTKEGIHGYFEMELTANHKFIGINKIR